MCATSPDATGFSGAMSLAAMAGGPGSQVLPPLYPSSACSMCSSSPTFRCIDVWNSLVSWCVGQGHLY